MEMLPDRSIMFTLRDDVKVHVSFVSPTQLRVEMMRDGVTVPPDTGNPASRSFRQRLADSAREYFNEKPKGDDNPINRVKNIDEDLGKVASLLGVPEIAANLREEAGPTVAEQLVDFVEDAGELFLTPDGKPHVSATVEEHTETYELGSGQFRVWLRAHFLARERQRAHDNAIASREQMIERLGAMTPDSLADEIPVRKPPIVRAQAIEDAISQLTSIALLEKRIADMHLRIGGAEVDGREKIYIDLGGEEWEAVEVDSDGWRIVQNPPIRFVRANGMLPLPHPVQGGSVDELRKILTLSDSVEDKHAWRLIVAWLVQALRPGRGAYPVLVLLGGHGTAKSTTARIVRQMIDPNHVRDVRKPRSEEEIHIDAVCSWVLVLDNISGLQPWLSDVICRVATGSAMTKRKLYSDRDREIFVATQPQILNGISDVATAGDLLRRSLLVNLPVLTKYKSDHEIHASVEAAHPGILGALLDAVSAGLRSIEAGEEINAQLGSMADFGEWAVRTERALGGQPGDFVKAYDDAHGDATSTVLEGSPFSVALFKFASKFTAAEHWTGISKQLLDKLNETESDEALKRSKDWPKTPEALSGALRRLAPALQEVGVQARRTNSSNRKGRQLEVFYEKPKPGPSGDGSDGSKGATVPTTVPGEDPISKPESRPGDGGDGGDAGDAPKPSDNGEDYLEL